MTQDQQIPECVRVNITKHLDEIYQHAIHPANRTGLSLNISIPVNVNELLVQHSTLYCGHKGYKKGLDSMTTEEREAVNAKISKVLTGKLRANISKVLTGKKLSAEHNANISKAHMGMKRSAEYRANISKAKTG